LDKNCHYCSVWRILVTIWLCYERMTMRLEHIALNVADPDAMARWYTSHLGMQIVRHIPTPNATYFLADSARMSVIEIYHNPAAPVPRLRRLLAAGVAPGVQQ
jgi:catechol 2,3-dioxygenase-like lactoylglutathione lyase family enzyme